MTFKFSLILSGLFMPYLFKISYKDLLSSFSYLYNIKAFGQRVALKAAFTMLYTVKDLTHSRL